MVRLYFEDENEEKDKKNYVDIHFWSIAKAYFFGWLGTTMIIVGSILGISILILILGYIF